MPTVEHDTANEQFEVRTPEGIAFLRYRKRKGRIHFIHTEVPEALRGQGIGESMARAGLEYARAEGLAVYPHCPYVAEFIQRNPEYQPLVHK